MTCNEAAEFVSVLFDGETIPRAAAEHIGSCEVCRERLKQYAEMSAELRRAASLDFTDGITPPVWDKRQQTSNHWWQKGRETMRIPRLAFALLVAGIVVLSSSLAIVGVRAHSEGTVVLLKVALPSGNTADCTLSAVDKKWATCMLVGEVNHGFLSYRIDLLSRDGDQAELGVRALFTPPGDSLRQHPFTLAGIDRLPQQKYSFDPGKTLELNVPGLGKLPVTGEWTDHVPYQTGAQNHDLDPGPDELRVISPVLVQGNEILADLAHMSAISDQPDQAVVFYQPGLGRYVLSLAPLKNSVEGSIKVNRISFEVDNQTYTFITGTPVARSEHIWIQHDPNFQPPTGIQGGFNAVESVRDQLAEPATAK